MIEPMDLAAYEQAKEEFKQKLVQDVDQLFESLLVRLSSSGRHRLETPPSDICASAASDDVYQDVPLNLVFRPEECDQKHDLNQNEPNCNENCDGKDCVSENSFEVKQEILEQEVPIPTPEIEPPQSNLIPEPSQFLQEEPLDHHHHHPDPAESPRSQISIPGVFFPDPPAAKDQPPESIETSINAQNSELLKQISQEILEEEREAKRLKRCHSTGNELTKDAGNASVEEERSERQKGSLHQSDNESSSDHDGELRLVIDEHDDDDDGQEEGEIGKDDSIVDKLEVKPEIRKSDSPARIATPVSFKIKPSKATKENALAPESKRRELAKIPFLTRKHSKSETEEGELDEKDHKSRSSSRSSARSKRSPSRSISSSSNKKRVVSKAKDYLDARESRYANKFNTIYVSCLDPGCGKTFESREKLDRHMDHVHDLLPYKCPVYKCGKRVRNRSILAHHFRSEHRNVTRWKCHECFNYFACADFLYRHVIFEHHEGRFTCGFTGCDFVSKHRATVINHFKRAHVKHLGEEDDDDYDKSRHEEANEGNSIGSEVSRKYKVAARKCFAESCDQFFITNQDLNQHLVAEHQIQAHRCPLDGCGKSFKIRKDLDQHYKESHKSQTSWDCTKCTNPTHFTNPHDLSTHIMHYHWEGQISCRECRFMAKHRGHVIEHFDSFHVSASTRGEKRKSS